MRMTPTVALLGLEVINLSFYTRECHIDRLTHLRVPLQIGRHTYSTYTKTHFCQPTKVCFVALFL